jgi:large conductance mechanosensitive channel
MMKEFREFILRGNVLDLAVGVIIGAAFGGIVSSLVNDVIMPPIGLALGSVDFRDLFLVLKEGANNPGPYATLALAKEAGAVTLNYGSFVNTVVQFLIIGFSIFLVVRAANKIHKKAAPPPPAPTRECPFCYSTVAPKATRCPHCTSELKAA